MGWVLRYNYKNIVNPKSVIFSDQTDHCRLLDKLTFITLERSEVSDLAVPGVLAPLWSGSTSSDLTEKSRTMLFSCM